MKDYMLCAAFLAFILPAIAVAQMPGDGYPSNYGPAYPNAPGTMRYGDVPGAPAAPMQAARPNSWPGAAPAEQPGIPASYSIPAPQPPVAGTPADDAQLCGSAQIIARVGKDVILTNDLLGGIDELLNRNLQKVSASKRAEQREQFYAEVVAALKLLLEHMNTPNPGSYLDPTARAILMQLIRQQVEAKLLFQDFRRNSPAGEHMSEIQESVAREFERTQLKELLKRENVVSQQDLEFKLRARGDSLEREKYAFFEQMVGQQWLHMQVKSADAEITHDDMLTWYKEHAAEFDIAAHAVWEQLMVDFKKYPTKEAAYNALAQMGNQILAGAGWADVAKARSNGSTASKGGVREKTTQGALASDVLDKALFSLPVGRMSPILEDASGFHIIRVITRQDATRTSFLDAQKEIREKIKKERLSKEYKEYVAKLQKQYPVWTIFDDPSKRPATE